MSSVGPIVSQILTLDLVIIKFEWEKKTYQWLLSDATMFTLSLLTCHLDWYTYHIPIMHEQYLTQATLQVCTSFLWWHLIYSKIWKEHLHHLEEVLKILHDKSLFVKLSKCEFGLTELLYLAHIISQDGVKVDMEKIRSILEWPRPKSITGLRGFSHLTSPLTDLIKKYDFQWH